MGSRQECGEVLHAAGKILRHGYGSYDPTVPYHAGNRRALNIELGDLRAAIVLMEDAKDVDRDHVAHCAGTKLQTVKRWMHHQDSTAGGTEHG